MCWEAVITANGWPLLNQTKQKDSKNTWAATYLGTAFACSGLVQVHICMTGIQEEDKKKKKKICNMYL